MKTILICKDCLSGQEESLAMYENNSQVNIFYTECMGVCPSGKISAIQLDKELINSTKSESLTLNELINTLNSDYNILEMY